VSCIFIVVFYYIYCMRYKLIHAFSCYENAKKFLIVNHDLIICKSFFFFFFKFRIVIPFLSLSLYF
jgi:hypothetical protein